MKGKKAKMNFNILFAPSNLFKNVQNAMGTIKILEMLKHY